MGNARTAEYNCMRTGRESGSLPGAAAEVVAPRQAFEAQVEVSPGMMPGANLNALLDETLRDPLSGNAVLSGIPIEMHPAA